MSFENQIKKWLEKGKIKKQAPNKDQIKVLIEKSQKDLFVANKNLEIDLETAYNLAYTSMLKAGRAFILSKGYRTTDSGQHKTTVDFCKFFTESESLSNSFDRMRRNRNVILYDPHDFEIIDEDEVLTAIETAKKFLITIKKITI